MLDGIISIVSLAIVAALCVLGVFHPRYDDTLGQRIGMALIGAWCVLRLQVKFQTFDTQPVHLVLHVGLAFYACGTALKMWREGRFKDRHDRIMQRLRDDDLHKVAGGRDA